MEVIDARHLLSGVLYSNWKETLVGKIVYLRYHVIVRSNAIWNTRFRHCFETSICGINFDA